MSRNSDFEDNFQDLIEFQQKDCHESEIPMKVDLVPCHNLVIH